MKVTPERQINLNSKFLPLLAGVILIVHLIAPYHGWQILLIGFGGAFILSYFWARSLAFGLELDREMHFEWAQVGDQIKERFQIFNYSWVPALWIETIDNSTIPNYASHQIKSVKQKDWIQWNKTAICTHRGEFTLGPTSLQTSDPFGLFTVTLLYPSSISLIVLPPVLPLPAIEVAPGGRAGEGHGRINTIERSVSAASVREYLPGDSLRWVHWPTSARRDSLYVRLFDGTPSSDWWILLDMDRAVHYGEDFDATEEYAVVLAASLADQGLKAGQAVGLILDNESLVLHTPHAGEGQRWEIMHTLASTSLGSRSLPDLISGVGPTLGHHASLVLITPSLKLDWTEELLHLTRQGVIPTVILLGPASFGREADLDMLRKTLTDQGIRNSVVTRETLNIFESHFKENVPSEEHPTTLNRRGLSSWSPDIKWDIFG